MVNFTSFDLLWENPEIEIKISEAMTRNVFFILIKYGVKVVRLAGFIENVCDL